MSEGIFASQKKFHLKKIRFSTYIEKVEDTEFAHFFEDEPRWTYTPRLHHIYLKHFQGHHGRFLECKTATAVVTSPVFIHCCRRVLLYKIQARLPDKTVVLPVLPTVDFEPDIFQNLILLTVWSLENTLCVKSKEFKCDFEIVWATLYDRLVCNIIAVNQCGELQLRM